MKNKSTRSLWWITVMGFGLVLFFCGDAQSVLSPGKWDSFWLILTGYYNECFFIVSDIAFALLSLGFSIWSGFYLFKKVGWKILWVLPLIIPAIILIMITYVCLTGFIYFLRQLGFS